MLLCRQSLGYVFACCFYLLAPAVSAAKGALPKGDAPEQQTEKASRLRQPPRVSLFGGYQVVQGNLKGVLPGGIDARLAFDLPLGRGAWPAMRLELGYTGFGALPGKSTYAVTGVAWAAGPVWLMQPGKQHHGQIIGGFLLGSILARIQGPAVDTQTNLFAAMALLGYEYPLGPVLLFVQARGGYIADQNNPLMSAGGVIGVTRPLLDD